MYGTVAFTPRRTGQDEGRRQHGSLSEGGKLDGDSCTKTVDAKNRLRLLIRRGPCR